MRVEHSFDVAIRGVVGLPSAAQLLDLGLHAPAQRYLRYLFPGEVWRGRVQSQCRGDDPAGVRFKGTC